MATDSNSVSVHRTLQGTVADTVTITQVWDRLRITNRDVTYGQDLWVIAGATPTLTAALNGSHYIPAGCSIEIDYGSQGVLQVVGSSNPYSVEGVTTVADSRGL